jgi:formate-dependent nitrite reductase cytochrome c552 subunit
LDGSGIEPGPEPKTWSQQVLFTDWTENQAATVDVDVQPKAGIRIRRLHLMKRIVLLSTMFLAAASFAGAQLTTPTTDVLGAHLNYGRGCAACHAPHSGAAGNGIDKSGDPNTGNAALWGEDVGNLYGRTLTFGQMLPEGGSTTVYTETLPTSLTATTPDVGGVLMCLSCHDGNYAEGAMMKNKVYETLPSTYGTSNNIPTLLGNDGSTVGNYLNDHPVGLNAAMSCSGPYNWDCTITATGSVLMNGPNSSKFQTNYGFFVSPGTYNSTPVVLCTTCHNQHVMNVVNVTASSKSGLPTGSYATMFFLRGPYNPADTNQGTNQTAQFCRQCHGGESNEANGSTAGTIF